MMLLTVLLFLVEDCIAAGITIPLAESQNITDAVIKDLMVTEPQKNYIFINYENYVPCGFSPCERFSTSVLNSHTPYKSPNLVFSYLRIKTVSDKDTIIILGFNSCTNVDFHLLINVKRICEKCFTIIALRNVNCFDFLKNYLIENELFNVYIFKRLTMSEGYLIHKVCAFCNFGKHELEFCNSWYHGKGFKNQFKLESSFKGRFYGAKIKVGLQLQQKPYVFKIGQSKSGSPIYGGEEYWLLEAVAKYLQFIPVLIDPNGFSCVNYYKGSTITGYCKMLLENDVQLAGFPFVITTRVFELFEPTAVYKAGTLSIISARPPEKTQWNSLVKKLQVSMILGIFILLLLVSFVIWLGNKSYGISGDSFLGILFDTIAILCLESVRCKNDKFSKQIVLGLWMISCFFVISVVFGAITSIAASPERSRDLINSLDDMDRYSLFWATVPYYTIDVFVRTRFPGKIPYIKKLKETEALAYIQDYPEQYVFIHFKEIVEYYISPQDRKKVFHISPSLAESPKYPVTILQRKGSLFTEKITIKVLQIEAAGLLNKFIDDTYRLLSPNLNLDQIPVEEKESGLFKWDNMATILVIHSLLISVALVVFLLELCHYYICRYFSVHPTIGYTVRQNLNYISGNCLKVGHNVMNVKPNFQIPKFKIIKI